MLEIRRIRKEKGISQKVLGELTGMFQNEISRIETGKRPPTVEEKVILAAVLEVPAEQLFQAQGPVRIPFSK